jgi:hypothetical protein
MRTIRIVASAAVALLFALSLSLPALAAAGDIGPDIGPVPGQSVAASFGPAPLVTADDVPLPPSSESAAVGLPFAESDTGSEMGNVPEVQPNTSDDAVAGLDTAAPDSADRLTALTGGASPATLGFADSGNSAATAVSAAPAPESSPLTPAPEPTPQPPMSQGYSY